MTHNASSTPTDGTELSRAAMLPRVGSLIQRIASDAVIDDTYAWLCGQRDGHSAGSDVWHLRFHWATERPRLQRELLAGTYGFEPVRMCKTEDGVLGIWSARDALVLKAVALVLQGVLAPKLSARCFHLAGRGGLKGAVRAVRDAIGDADDARFVYRSDVKGYYASIDHALLMREVRGLVRDGAVVALIERWLGHLADEDGVLRPVMRGITLGCPLSPLMGAVYLRPLDEAMARTGLVYVRYMDDWVVLAPSRWRLRRAIRECREVLAGLRVVPHPDKTYVGYVARGFDFLGYRFDSEAGRRGLGVAVQTVTRCQERIARLYERGASAGRIGRYVGCWLRWVTAGLGGGAGVRDEVEAWLGDGLCGGGVCRLGEHASCLLPFTAIE